MYAITATDGNARAGVYSLSMSSSTSGSVSTPAFVLPTRHGNVPFLTPDEMCQHVMTPATSSLCYLLSVQLGELYVYLVLYNNRYGYPPVSIVKEHNIRRGKTGISGYLGTERLSAVPIVMTVHDVRGVHGVTGAASNSSVKLQTQGGIKEVTVQEIADYCDLCHYDIVECPADEPYQPVPVMPGDDDDRATDADSKYHKEYSQSPLTDKLVPVPVIGHTRIKKSITRTVGLHSSFILSLPLMWRPMLWAVVGGGVHDIMRRQAMTSFDKQYDGYVLAEAPDSVDLYADVVRADV